MGKGHVPDALFRHVRMYLMKGIWWPVFEKTQFIDEITFQQILDFSNLFRSHLTMTILIAGNMTAEVMIPFAQESNPQSPVSSSQLRNQRASSTRLNISSDWVQCHRSWCQG